LPKPAVSASSLIPINGSWVLGYADWNANWPTWRSWVWNRTSPYVRSSERLAAFARTHHLAVIGGSDAHFPQHLLKWTTVFPGNTPADLLRALEARTTQPQEGELSAKVPMSELALQQWQALLVHPTRKVARLVGLERMAR